jgi:hypothetical protein
MDLFIIHYVVICKYRLIKVFGHPWSCQRAGTMVWVRNCCRGSVKKIWDFLWGLVPKFTENRPFRGRHDANHRKLAPPNLGVWDIYRDYPGSCLSGLKGSRWIRARRGRFERRALMHWWPNYVKRSCDLPRSLSPPRLNLLPPYSQGFLCEDIRGPASNIWYCRCKVQRMR